MMFLIFVGPHELRPSDILIERFQAWKRLVKNLIAYFEGIADIEVSKDSKMTRLEVLMFIFFVVKYCQGVNQVGRSNSSSI